MSVESAKLVKVTCGNCLKDFSSSTIFLHHKKYHPGLQVTFQPERTRCGKCEENVEITTISSHYLTCSQETRTLNIVQEDSSETCRTCRFCKRRFLLERIEKHQQACQWASKKRPVFDMAKKRLPLLSFTERPNSLRVSPKRSPPLLKYPNSKWQKQHLQLIESLRKSKKTSVYADYLPCKYCSRKFAPNIAESHIEICKFILNKPKPPPVVLNLKRTVKKVKSMKEIFGKNEGNGIFLKKKKNDLTLPRTESREENRDDDGEVKEIGLGHGVSNTPAVQRKKKKGKNGQSARFDKFGKRNMERKISLKQIYQDDLEIKRIVLQCNGCGFVSDNSKFCVNCGSLSLVKLESL